MAKQNWLPVDFSKAIGMSTNPDNPGRNTARRILNIHAHEKPGKLVLRPGYTLRYQTPDADDDNLFSTLSSITYLNFDLFYDLNANVDGEMFCLVSKGTLAALSGSSVADTQNMIQVWVRPYVGNWEWVNKTLITKITTATHVTNKSLIMVYGTNAQIPDGSLVGWTIYNKTKDEYAKVITNIYNGANEVRINHTLFDSDWEIDDVIIIGKNWIDLAYHTELFNAEWNDVVFHKIVRDLRIGFGGQENRPGLAVGYRNKFSVIKEVDWASVHADVTAAALETFAETDGIILDTSFLNNTDGYGLELNLVAGSLAAGVYYFRLTGSQDGYTEQLLAEASIEVDGTDNIESYPFIRLGKDNVRITHLNVYMSVKDDNTVFHKIREEAVRTNEYINAIGTIDETGRLIYIRNTELHTTPNAANLTSEANSADGWSSSNPPATVASSTDVTEFTTVPDGTYYIRWEKSGVSPGGTKFQLISPIFTTGKTRLSISLQIALHNIIPPYPIRITSIDSLYPNPFNGGSNPNDYFDITIVAADTWQAETIELEVNGYLMFEIETYGTSIEFVIGIDSLSATVITGQTTEMKTNMGYQPSFNVVKGWDQAKTWRGRAYYLNPFIDERFENYILVSHIHGNGAFMYDISTFANYRELERFDNSKAVGMEFLPNGDLFVLKDKTVEAIDPDTNALIREPIFGVNCIARESIVRLGSTVFWCGSDDIYFLNLSGFSAVGMLKDTIRDLYLGIVGRSDLHATRDKYNTYRVREYNATTKREFLFVGKEPVEEAKFNFALVYRVGYSARLFFMDTLGNIYSVDAEIDFNKFLTAEDWSDYIYEEDGVTKIPYEGN